MTSGVDNRPDFKVQIDPSPLNKPVEVLAPQGGRRSGSAKDSEHPPRRTGWAKHYARRLVVTDAVAIIWAGVGAHAVNIGVLNSELARHPLTLKNISVTVLFGVLWLAALALGGSRDASVVGYGADEYKNLIRATFGFFGLAAIFSFIFVLDLHRAYVLVMMPAGLVAVLAGRFIWRRWLHIQRQAGRYQSEVLVVGNMHTVREMMSELRRAALAGYRVMGACVSADGEAKIGDFIDGVPVLGHLDHVAEVASRSGAQMVAVTSTSAFGPRRVRELSWELEKTSIQLVLAPALTNIAGPRIHTTPVAGLPLIHVDRPTYRGANRLLKKSFDVIGASLLLFTFAPILLILAIAIRIADRGPIFFRQERVGINSRSFRMIKFRSMVTDAEARLAELRQDDRDAGNNILFKMKRDPRVTRVGRWLRRFSLDELPQLFNVLKGDMSLVGPRPPLRAEVDLYGDDARLRLLVKPGLTGLWQVSGRSDLTWEDTVRLDVYYVENWSITGDIVILWKTMKAVLASSGAY